MRVKLSVAMLGILAMIPVPVCAQQQMQTYSAPSYQFQGQQPSTPVYNAGNNAQPYYYGGQQNTGSYGGVTPYGFNNGAGADPLAGVTSIGALSPEQAAYVRAQRDAAAQAYQQQYFSGQQQQQGAGMSIYQNAFGNNSFFGQPEKKPPVKRRVVYNQKANPLSTPPRLFNPDQ